MISEFPLFVFTTFAGVAAGTYVASAVFPAKDNGKRRAWLFPLILLVLLAIGLLGCLGHIHRPERVLNALWNPLAGITQEAYLSILFGVMLVIDLCFCIAKKHCPRWVRIVGAVFALLLTCVMGYAYFTALGVQAWHTAATVALFPLGDLAMGFALYSVFSKETLASPKCFAVVTVVEALLAIALIALAVHFGGLGLGVVPFIVAIVLAPAVHIAIAFRAKSNAASWMTPVVCVCVIVGVVVARYVFYAASTIL